MCVFRAVVRGVLLVGEGWSEGAVKSMSITSVVEEVLAFAQKANNTHLMESLADLLFSAELPTRCFRKQPMFSSLDTVRCVGVNMYVRVSPSAGYGYNI